MTLAIAPDEVRPHDEVRAPLDDDCPDAEAVLLELDALSWPS